MWKKNPVSVLRMVGLVEGVSFLVLALVAMPLKYFAGRPEAVKVVGWVHGMLFVIFLVALVRVVVVARWPMGRAAGVLVAGLLPGGPLVIDRRMRRYEEEFAGRSLSAAEGSLE